MLIHGWNPFETENPYIEEGTEWNLLTDAISSSILGTDWELFPYNWSADAATGKIIGSLLKPADDGDGIKANTLYGKGVSNGSQAAEIAWMHGYNHLGGYILEKRPSIANIHIICHSAGSWMARAAAQYLNEHQPGISIQITFLDPYIPGEVGYKDIFSGTLVDEDSKLTLEKLRGIQNWNGVVKLDQYYTDGISDPYVLGTNSEIGWTQKGYTYKVVSLYVAKAHEYPIEWYADTVTNAPQADDDGEPYGWSRSLAYDAVTAVQDEPAAFHVSLPFPNPFNQSTTIRCSLPSATPVTVTVYDMLGRTVRVLVDETVQPGVHAVKWNGMAETGSAAGNGVYLYQVNAGRHTAQGKILLMK